MKTAKKVAIIVAVVMIVAGLAVSAGALFMLDFDFTKLNTISFVTNTYEIDEEISSISVNGAECDVRILPSEDGSCKVVCQESDKISHTIDVENNELVVERHDNRKWYEHIGVYWGEMEIAIYIPQGEYDDLYAKNLSGDIVIPEGFSFESAEVQSTSGSVRFLADVSGELSAQSTSGDVYIANASPTKLKATSTSGDVTIDHVTVQGSVIVKVVSGDMKLSGIRCESVTVNATSGDIDFSDVVTTDSIQAENVSGDIDLHMCDGASLWLKTSSGDVSGTLLTEKMFLTDTSSGDVDVPRSASGGECEIITVSGDIEFEIK